MKRNRMMKSRKFLRNNNHRRLMFKRSHQRMLHRRRQFVCYDLQPEIQRSAS
ncbi:hypothetical protein [Alteromonas lipotrueiana]|uniref:hypothetical protein n=1 Tax=Alteromonas lipotrueiana TaxID=2803815 RepID=UPI001C4400D5|nr:hypothetical protein [Alteromonas lipotrueiana]